MVWNQIYVSEFLQNFQFDSYTLSNRYCGTSYLQSDCRQFARTEWIYNFHSFHRSADLHVRPNDTEADSIFKPGEFVQFIDTRRGYCRVDYRERLTLE